MRKKVKRKTILIDGIRYYDDKPDTCRKCFFWKNRKVGCVLGTQNCYYLAEAVKTEQEKKCEGCCYAKGHPCVSAVCYKELDAWLRAIRANRAKEEGAANSISNQKAMLEEFAARQGFTNIVHFTDDGISGTCFDRPGFLAMMKEVEAGNVEYLCIKDMSRMGRDYLKVGQIMEILRQRGVRLIAINDGVDSARGDDDFTPFRNIMKNISCLGRVFC